MSLDDALIARNQTLLSHVMTRHAGHLLNSWRGPKSLAANQRAHTITESMAKANPANGFYQDLLDANAFFMGRLLVGMNEAAAGALALRQSIALLEKAVASGCATNQKNLGFARECLAEIEP